MLSDGRVLVAGNSDLLVPVIALASAKDTVGVGVFGCTLLCVIARFSNGRVLVTEASDLLVVGDACANATVAVTVHVDG